MMQKRSHKQSRNAKNRSTTNMKCSCSSVYCSKRRVKKKHETAKWAAKNRLSYSCGCLVQKTQQQQQLYFLLIIKLACSCNQQKHFWKPKKPKKKASDKSEKRKTKLQKAENVIKESKLSLQWLYFETDPLINKSTLTMTTTKPNSKIKPKQINKNITTNWKRCKKRFKRNKKTITT